jgi:hypothetical protein
MISTPLLRFYFQKEQNINFYKSGRNRRRKLFAKKKQSQPPLQSRLAFLGRQKE